MREGIVVGGVDYGEADRIVHLLTDIGCTHLFAHAAKKSRRRFSGALEPFTTIQAEIEDRRKTGLAVMSSASVVRARLRISSELLRIALAGYVCELAAQLAPEGDASAGLYALVTAALDRLDGVAPISPALRQAFELSLLSHLGYAAEVDACADCGAPPVAFDFERGGVLCEEHRGTALPIGPNTRAWMKAVLSLEGGFDETAGLPVEHAELAARKISRQLVAFYRGLLEHPLRSQAFLDQVTSL